MLISGPLSGDEMLWAPACTEAMSKFVRLGACSVPRAAADGRRVNADAAAPVRRLRAGPAPYLCTVWGCSVVLLCLSRRRSWALRLRGRSSRRGRCSGCLAGRRPPGRCRAWWPASAVLAGRLWSWPSVCCSAGYDLRRRASAALRLASAWGSATRMLRWGSRRRTDRGGWPRGLGGGGLGVGGWGLGALAEEENWLDDV